MVITQAQFPQQRSYYISMRTIKITTREHPPTSGLTPRMWAEYSVRRRYDWVLFYNKIEPTWTGTNKLLFYDVTNKANKTITKR